MMQTNRYWKFIIFTLAATLMVICGIGYFFWQDLPADQSLAVRSIFIERFEIFALILFIGFGVFFVGLEIIYKAYVKPIKKISAEAGVIYASNPSHRIQTSGSRDIANLCRIINDFADLFENLNKNVTDQILKARKETDKERNLLAAIMAELPQGVIICNNSGRILLFNSVAKKYFNAAHNGHRSEYFIGLGRSIFHLIDKGLIAKGLEQIEEILTQNKIHISATFISPTQDNRLLNIEMIPVLDTNKLMTGFILTLDDVTNAIQKYDAINDRLAYEKKELLFQINAAKHLLPENAAVNFDHTLNQITSRYDHIADTLLQSIIHPLHLSALPVMNLITAVQKKLSHAGRVQLHLQRNNHEHRVLADYYSFCTALTFLVRKISEGTGINKLNLTIKRNGNLIVFRLQWETAPIKREAMESIFKEKINALPSLNYVFMQNKTQYEIIKDDNGHCFQVDLIMRAKLNVPAAPKRQTAVITGSRPEFYDFDLFKSDMAGDSLLESPLKNLTYTVFDTETTGLNPDGGDEIISIAAVRIVNGRIVYQEIFEELVDPKRDIPIESYKIHGINYEMVAGKDDIHTILPRFKQYTLDTVMAGHNIAFDMKMLKVKEKATRVRFKNPVLDTLLLSAILHPVHEQHDMESIARRLGVNIIGRHTALGDAIATAEILLKIIPILNSNGILTLKDALKASRKTYYARLKY